MNKLDFEVDFISGEVLAQAKAAQELQEQLARRRAARERRRQGL